MIKRSIATTLVVAASLAATPAGPAEAINYPTACSGWEQSGSIDFRACVVDTYSSTMSNKVVVRNLSTVSKKVDLRVEGWVNGQVARTCTWNDLTIAGSATIERTCTVTHVDNYEYRSKAFYRSGSSTSQYLNQLSPALIG